MANPLRIGLIGLGRMGQNHLRVLSLLRGIQVQFVHDIDKERAKQISTLYSVRPSFNLMEDLKTVEAVIIATPTHTHFEIFNLVRQHVKNIFIEKPLTDKLSTSQEILDISKQSHLTVQVGFIERFNPAVLVLKNTILPKARVINIDFVRTNKLSKRILDVDVITDLMIHDLDLAHFLNGPIRSLSAFGTYSGAMVEFAKANLFHVNGTISTLTASRITERRKRQISLTCDGMFVDCNLLRKEVSLSVQTEEKYFDDLSITSTEDIIDVKPHEPLLNEILAFIELAIMAKPLGGLMGNLEDSVTAFAWAEQIKAEILSAS